jgi:hypothetical protein
MSETHLPPGSRKGLVFFFAQTFKKRIKHSTFKSKNDSTECQAVKQRKNVEERKMCAVYSVGT